MSVTPIPAPAVTATCPYPGQPGHECYTYAEWRAQLVKVETNDDH